MNDKLVCLSYKQARSDAVPYDLYTQGDLWSQSLGGQKSLSLDINYMASRSNCSVIANLECETGKKIQIDLQLSTNLW